MTEQEMLKLAVRFQVAEDVFVEKRGNDSWCVSVFRTVLDRDLTRQYEPMVSGRTDDFIAATRFTLEEAFEIATRYCKNES